MTLNEEDLNLLLECSLEWEQTLFDNRNGVLETIWLNKKHGIIKEEIVSKSGIDTSFTVVKTHQTYHTFEEAVLHS